MQTEIMKIIIPPTIPTYFERIFHPQSIAIIGVSAESGGTGFGSGMFRAIKTMGFEGKMFPVNPKGGNLNGLQIYKQVEDIPGKVDFAIITVSAKYVPEVLEGCLKKGIEGVEIISSGFSELGDEAGKELENRVQQIAATGIRVIGPNCFGIYCPKSALTLLPGPDLSRQSGPVAFISQSGGMAIDLALKGKWMGIRFSKVISFGNGADLRETELLQYLADDPETKVICMYIEGIKDGDAFFESIKYAAKKKPVIVCKGGLSLAGNRSVASHTASMGGSRVIWQSVLKQVNAIQVQDLGELAEAALAFSLLPVGIFKRISVIGGGGALGVSACDAAEVLGIEIPPFSKEQQESIGQFLPKPGSSAINPIDVANPFVSPLALKEILLMAGKDSRVDLQIIVSLLYHYKVMATAMGLKVADVAPFRELADVIRDVVKTTGKPVVVVLPNPKKGLYDLDLMEMLVLARSEFLERDLPVFDELPEALRAMDHVSSYFEQRTNNHE